MRRSLRRASATLMLAAAPLTLACAQQRTATFLGYTTPVPAGWTTRAPSSRMRLAEYVVPDKNGMGSAEVVVFFFGPTQGGNVEANLERWRAQFSTPDGSPVPESVTRDSSGKFPLTFAEFRGTYRRGVGIGSADSVRTGQTLIAAVAETPKGALFMQMFGPSARVEAERDGFKGFVTGLR